MKIQLYDGNVILYVYRSMDRYCGEAELDEIQSFIPRSRQIKKEGEVP